MHEHSTTSYLTFELYDIVPIYNIIIVILMVRTMACNCGSSKHDTQSESNN